MAQRIVRLANGAEFPISVCGEYAGYLWIHGTIHIADACVLFSAPDNLTVIVDTFKDSEETRRVEWEGYTTIYMICTDPDGQTRIGLKRSDGA